MKFIGGIPTGFLWTCIVAICILSVANGKKIVLLRPIFFSLAKASFVKLIWILIGLSIYSARI